MLNIAGRIFVQIKVDGNDLPQSANLIEKVTMTEGNGALSPAIELLLNDYQGSLSKELALTDGNELLVTVGKTPNDINTQSRQYRLFGVRTIPTGFGPRMQILGIYDAPGYLTGSVRESFKDTSSNVMRSVAARCKLEYYGPEDFNGRKTDDNQVWLNVTKSRALFAQTTTRHGFVDEHSCMYSALTSLGQLRYLNLNDVIETPKENIRRMFVHNTYPSESDGSVQTFEVYQARTRSTAGLMNNWQNYGSTKVEHGLDGDGQTHDKVNVKTSAEYLPINETVKKTVERSRLEYSPLDCGNTHTNFNKALYQNIKMLSLFSEHVSLLTYDVTDVQLLDVVIYRQANADPKVAVSNSDIYLVIGKTIMVKSGHYAERIELVRHNITEKGATELSSAASLSTADSTIPNSTIDPTSNVGATALPTAVGLSGMSAPVQTQMTQMRGTMPDMRKAAGFATPSIKQIRTTVKDAKKGVNNARQLVAQVKGSIQSLKHYNQMGKQFANQMRYSVSGLMQLNQDIKNKNVHAVLRTAILFQRNGVMNSMTAALGGVKQQMQMASALQPLSMHLNANLAQLETVPGGRDAVRAFNAEHQQIVQNANDSRMQSAHMWNQSLSIMNGSPIPDVQKMSPRNALKMAKVMTNLYREPPSRSTDAVPLSTATADVTNEMTARSTDRQPNWINPNDSWDYDSSITNSRTTYNETHSVSYAARNETLWSGTNSNDSYINSVEASEHAHDMLEREAPMSEARENDDGSEG